MVIKISNQWVKSNFIITIIIIIIYYLSPAGGPFVPRVPGGAG